jgi:hypothetical protein
VKIALEPLPEPQQTAVVACWMNGESAAEFAAAEGWKASTVRGHLHRAKPALQKALKPYAPPSSPIDRRPQLKRFRGFVEEEVRGGASHWPHGT